MKKSNESLRDIGHHELCNWSCWCWTGAWPHPLPFGVDPAQLREDEPTGTPPQADRARRVDAIYQALPLVEQRVIQAEYPRRHEYAAGSRKDLMRIASAAIGIGEAYYALTVDRVKAQVGEEFYRCSTRKRFCP